MKISQRAGSIFHYTFTVFIAVTVFGLYSYFSVSNDLYSNLKKEIVLASNNFEKITSKYLSELSTSAADSNKIESTNTLPDSRQMLNDLTSIIPHGLLQIADASGRIVFKSEGLGKEALPVMPPEGSQSKSNPAELTGKNIDIDSSSHHIIDSSSHHIIDSSSHHIIDSSSHHILSERLAGMPGDSALMEYEIGGRAYLLFVKRTSKMSLSLALPVENMNEIFKESTGKMIWAALIIILISFFIAYITSTKNKDQLLSIRQTAGRITSNTLDLRFHESGNNDDLDELTVKLNNMIDRLEKSYRRNKQFTSDASHELRTPLAILRGELEIALMKEKSVEEYEIITTSALEEVNRLINVVETLLELSRADSGRISMNFEKGNMSHLLEDIAEDAEILAESKNMSVDTSIDSGIEFKYDSVRMHEAILNIIDNAVKYTPEGGCLKLGLQEFENYAEITVSDNGVGIPKDKLDKIFERFFRIGGNSQKIQGSGLGLSIVRWIVNAHNGRVLVESQPGVGTTFSIRLPKPANSHKIH